MNAIVHNIGRVIVVFASASLSIFPDGSMEKRNPIGKREFVVIGGC